MFVDTPLTFGAPPVLSTFPHLPYLHHHPHGHVHDHHLDDGSYLSHFLASSSGLVYGSGTVSYPNIVPTPSPAVLVDEFGSRTPIAFLPPLSSTVSGNNHWPPPPSAALLRNHAADTLFGLGRGTVAPATTPHAAGHEQGQAYASGGEPVVDTPSASGAFDTLALEEADAILSTLSFPPPMTTFVQALPQPTHLPSHNGADSSSSGMHMPAGSDVLSGPFDQTGVGMAPYDLLSQLVMYCSRDPEEGAPEPVVVIPPVPSRSSGPDIDGVEPGLHHQPHSQHARKPRSWSFGDASYRIPRLTPVAEHLPQPSSQQGPHPPRPPRTSATGTSPNHRRARPEHTQPSLSSAGVLPAPAEADEVHVTSRSALFDFSMASSVPQVHMSAAASPPPLHPTAGEPSSYGFSTAPDVAVFPATQYMTVAAVSAPCAIFQRRKVCVCCQSTSTPMWREGKQHRILCNACGIRFQKYAVSCDSCEYVPRKNECLNQCVKCQAPLAPPDPSRRPRSSSVSSLPDTPG